MPSQLDALTSPVDRYSFAGKNDWPGLLSVLKAHKDSTVLVGIQKPADVLVHTNGRLQGKWKFTNPALGKYCRALCPGLAPLVTNMLEEKEAGPADVQAVIDVINRIASARASKLQGYNWLIDSSTGRVLGLVSAKYRMTFSFDLMEHVHSYVLASRRLGFFDASIYHRRISLRFVGKEPSFTLPVGDSTEPFFSGFYFGNSEVGDYAIHAAPLILRGWTRCGAIAPSHEEGGRLMHVKMKKFNQKLYTVLDSSLLSKDQLAEMRASFMQMRETALGVGTTAAAQKKNLEALIDRFQAAGLTTGASRALIGTMVTTGSYKWDRLLPNTSVIAATARRNFYDLWNALTSEGAKMSSVIERETAENLAFKMLIGKFLFTRGR